MRLRLLALSSLIFFSCSEHRPVNPKIKKYGLGWDSIRKAIGLPIINGNLTLTNYGYECLDPYTDCAMF